MGFLNEFRKPFDEVVPRSTRIPLTGFIVVFLLENIEVMWCYLVGEGVSDVFRMNSAEPSFEVSTDVLVEIEGVNLDKSINIESFGSHLCWINREICVINLSVKVYGVNIVCVSIN